MDNTTYRRNKFIIGSDWHCNPNCPSWPQRDYFEADFLDPNKGDHLCADCTLYAYTPAQKKPRHAA